MRSAFSVSLALALAFPVVAHAHGGRPQTYDVLFGATTDDMVVPGTFGVMTTTDGGARWEWLCIEGMPDAMRGVIRPATRTPDDTILFAEHFGLLEGHDRACDPVFEPSLAERYVADVVRIPGGGFAALPSDASMPNRLYVSSDGTAFAPVGDAFPSELLPERVRYAPSDPMRVYVSGEIPGAGTVRYRAMLYTSSDGGMHWSGLDVPLSAGETVLRVLEVDPHDPDHLFLVAQSSMEDRLIEVTAGPVLTDRLQIPAVAVAVNRPFALGFASDGAVWLGNTMAGLFRILPGDSPRSIDKFLHTACVVPHGDDVYLCGDGLADAFALGVQHPGTTYAPVPLLVFSQLTVRRTCGGPIDAVCGQWWDDLYVDTGRADQIPDAGPAEAGVPDDGGVSPPSRGPGCSCAASRARFSPLALGVGIALVLGLARRLRQSGRDRRAVLLLDGA